MFSKGKVKSLLSRFKADKRGNVAIIFGITAVPMIIAAGCAVDLARAHIVQNRLQAALDAGALATAAAVGLSEEERIEKGEVTFQANYPAHKLGTPAAPAFTIEDGVVLASVQANLPTTVMNLAGVKDIDVSTSTEITVPSLKDGEIVMVLDYSGSMNTKGKYQAMREAAIDLVNTLTEDGENEDVKFGLVPFSHHVYTTLPKKYVAGQSGFGNWTGCTYDRKYPHNTQASTPDEDDDDTKWGITVSDPHNAWGCNGYQSRDLVVRPLTSDHDGTIDQLEDMKPYAWTNIALGMAFGWHLLSPNAPYAEGTSYNNDDVMKAIVLLTDGRQTQKSWGPGGSRTVANGEENLETLCERVKDLGVLVITVAFDLEDQDTEDRLKQCASDDEYFYIAEDNAQLASSFKAITQQLAKAVYISK